jgi:hypothetical protein
LRILSPMASIARGSVAGLTFLANQYHQIVVRQRTAPVNPKTFNQELMRMCFSNASTQWKGISESDRSKWDDYSQSVKFPGPLGDYSITGRNMFMANLSLVYYINSRALDTVVVSLSPPNVEGVPSWSDLSVDAPTTTGTGISVHLGNTCGYDMNYFITLSPPQDPSRERYKGPFLSESAVSDEITDSSSDDVDFIGLTLGRRYFVRIKGVTVGGPHRQTFEVILNGLAQATV